MVATWWMGVILGVLIAGSALAGSMQPAPYESVRPRLYRLIIATGICTFVFGSLIKVTGLTMPPMAQWPWYNNFSFATQQRFTADLVAHNVAYLSAAVGALVVCILNILERWKVCKATALVSESPTRHL